MSILQLLIEADHPVENNSIMKIALLVNFFIARVSGDHGSRCRLQRDRISSSRVVYVFIYTARI